MNPVSIPHFGTTNTSCYSCSSCGKNYKRKIFYERHVTLCGLYTRDLDRDTDADGYEPLPSKREMFQMIQLLATKCDTMETQMKQLRSTVSYKQQSFNVPELLLCNGRPTKTVDEIINGLSIQMTVFERIHDVSIDILVAELICSCIHNPEINVSPIRGISTQNNKLYLWDGTKYIIAQTDTITRLYDLVTHKLLIKFAEWDAVNRIQICRDDYTELYTRIAKKLLGGSTSKDAVVRKVLHLVYIDISEDINDMYTKNYTDL